MPKVSAKEEKNKMIEHEKRAERVLVVNKKFKQPFSTIETADLEILLLDLSRLKNRVCKAEMRLKEFRDELEYVKIRNTQLAAEIEHLKRNILLAEG